MTGHTKEETLRVMDALLTAEIFNRFEELGINDLTPSHRDLFQAGADGNTEVKRPLFVTEKMLDSNLEKSESTGKRIINPFVEHEEFGQRFAITSLEPAAEWLLKNGGKEHITNNPVLAYYYERQSGTGISYNEAKKKNPKFEDNKKYLDARVSRIVAGSEEMRTARDLIIIKSPEEIEYSMEGFVCTPSQEDVIKKIEIAIENRDYLNKSGIHEIGKILFVGPPGTGKTTLSIALSRHLHMPLLEVRLAMLTSQYLGETSKNIDRIFEIARQISPCILFIDEFDFVAKTRVSDDHGAMKRAVNMLLKNIDSVSLIRNGVLLIGATNHPRLLDEAAWRRFDEIVSFELPDCGMRHEILKRITSSVDCDFDMELLAETTDGFSGADLKMLVKEAVLSALIDDRTTVSKQDIEKGTELVDKRSRIRNNT